MKPVYLVKVFRNGGEIARCWCWVRDAADDAFAFAISELDPAFVWMVDVRTGEVLVRWEMASRNEQASPSAPVLQNVGGGSGGHAPQLKRRRRR